jgi:hypothetical protein
MDVQEALQPLPLLELRKKIWDNLEPEEEKQNPSPRCSKSSNNTWLNQNLPRLIK